MRFIDTIKEVEFDDQGRIVKVKGQYTARDLQKGADSE